jgi:hypothetical protein
VERRQLRERERERERVQKCRSEDRIRQHTEVGRTKYGRITEDKRCKMQTTERDSVSRRS